MLNRRDQERMQAITPQDFTITVHASGARCRANDLVRRTWSDFLYFKTIECGSPVALGSCFSIAADCDRPAVLTALCRAIERIAIDKHAGAVVFRDFVTEELEGCARLFGNAYSRLNHLPMALMDVPWEDPRHYANSLRSKYRYNFNQCRKRLACAEIAVEITADFADHAEKFQQLWRNVYNNAKEFRREYLDVPFF